MSLLEVVEHNLKVKMMIWKTIQKYSQNKKVERGKERERRKGGKEEWRKKGREEEREGGRSGTRERGRQR
jgi:hypothetical protein